MNLYVTEDVAKWYKQEFDLDEPAYFRFYIRYGSGGHIPGFSLGIRIDSPKETCASAIVNDITFFIETDDAWYFSGKDLHVTWDEHQQEPKFVYK
ncbi:hypothetical protein ABRT01_08290 [Lentibacillus sp. L22]|uniref:HesB/YadR/YfhF family protein n=1 Tax=Lentibacillus TaxID=175304 RepID=UPI0022B1D67B|nr:hypothetical protein [Lentibacillus daqui]